MAKMFGSNVGLEDTAITGSEPETGIAGACHGIPNTGNTCYIGKCLHSHPVGQTGSQIENSLKLRFSNVLTV